MSDRHANLCLLVLSTIAAGCSSSSNPPAWPAPTPADVQRGERLRANVDLARELLESGDLRAGRPLDEFLSLCTPYRIDFVDRYAFIEFFSVPNLTGLSLVAADGKLASATEWGCVTSHEYFNALSEADQQAASATYQGRLHGSPR